jgi:hypothetical protein
VKKNVDFLGILAQGLLISGVSLSIVIAYGNCVLGEDSKTTETVKQQQELLKLQLENQKLLYQTTKDVLQIQKDIDAKDSAVYKGKGSGLSSSISVGEGAFTVGPAVMSYQALSKVAKAIYQDLTARVSGISTIVIVPENNPSILSDIQSLNSFYGILDTLTEGYKELEKQLGSLQGLASTQSRSPGNRRYSSPALPGLVGPLIGGYISPIADLLSWFRTSDNYYSSPVESDYFALASLIANEASKNSSTSPRNLSESTPIVIPITPSSTQIPETSQGLPPTDNVTVVPQQLSIYYPNIMPGNLLSLGNELNSPAGRVQQLEQLRIRVVGMAIKLQNKYPKDDPRISSINEYLKPLESAHSKLFEMLSTITGSNGFQATIISRLNTAAYIKRRLSDSEGSYFLVIKSQQGGNARTRSNIFTVFTGAWVNYSGGAIVSYMLFNPNGSLRTSNNLYYNTGYGGSGSNTNIVNER